MEGYVPAGVSQSTGKLDVMRATRPNEELIQGLNEDLAAEWGTILRYTFQSAKALGLRGAELREILDKNIPDELGHARYLTDVICDFDGHPAMEPRHWEHVGELKPMIEQDLNMELLCVKNYTQHSKLAEILGLTELKVKLENMAADESRHARELNRILRGL